MGYYQRKAQIVEAEQWFPGKAIPGVIEQTVAVQDGFIHAFIGDPRTGMHPVSPGDFIIENNEGVQECVREHDFLYNFQPIEVTIQGEQHEVSQELFCGQPEDLAEGSLGGDQRDPE